MKIVRSGNRVAPGLRRARRRVGVAGSASLLLASVVAIPAGTASAATTNLYTSSGSGYTPSAVPIFPVGSCFAEVTAMGGAGGAGTGGSAGAGADITARVPVVPGSGLNFSVGGVGGTGSTGGSGGYGGGGGGGDDDSTGGGGGATVLDEGGAYPLVVAGGGGGSGALAISNGGDAGVPGSGGSPGGGAGGASEGGGGTSNGGGGSGGANSVQGGGGGGGVISGGTGGTTNTTFAGGDGAAGASGMGGGGGSGATAFNTSGTSGTSGSNAPGSGSGGSSVGATAGGAGDHTGGNGAAAPAYTNGTTYYGGAGGGGGLGFGGGGGGGTYASSGSGGGGGGGGGFGAGGGGGYAGGGGGGSSYVTPFASVSSEAADSTAVGSLQVSYEPGSDACESVEYVTGGAPVAAYPSLAVPDLSGLAITGATVTIGGYETGDVLTAAYNPNVTAVYDASTHTLTLTGNGSATAGDFQSVLDSVTFSSSANDPTVGGTAMQRTLTWQLTDPTGPTAPVTSYVQIDTTCVWTGGTGTNWSTASNWSCGQAPAAGDSVVFPNNSAATTTTDDIALASGSSFAAVAFDGGTWTVDGTDALAPGASLSASGSLSSLANVTINSPITFAPTPAPTVQAGYGSLNLAGQITYSGTSPIQAYGNVYISGANGSTLTGGIQISPSGLTGTLTASTDSGALGTGKVLIGPGGTLQLGASGLAGVSPSAPLEALGNGTGPTCSGTADDNLNDSAGGDSYNGTVQIDQCATLFVNSGGTSPFTLTKAISGAGALTEQGNGTLYLDAANTYTGPTTVQLATLGGTGTVSTTTVTGGTLAPGAPTGTLTVNGALTVDSGSTLTATLTSPTNGGYSQVSVNGAVDLTGATLNLTTTNGFISAYGDQFDLVVNNSGSPVTGTFAGLAQGADLTLGGQTFQLSYTGGTSGHDVVLTQISGAPAPPPPTSPTPPAPPAGATSSASGASPTGGGPVKVSLPPLSVSTSGGTGALTVALYGGNPVAKAPGGSSPVFFDLALAAGSSFTSVQFSDCSAAPGSLLAWWNPAAGLWQPVTPAPVRSSGCAVVTLDATSSPSLAQLTGTVFALTTPVTTPPVPPTTAGYRLAGADGGVFSFGDAAFHGSAAPDHPAAPIVGIAATPDGRGYWLVGSDGGVFSYGDAGFYGSAAGAHPAAPIVGIAATPDGHGYWLTDSDGAVFAFGDAASYGSLTGTTLDAPITGIAATPDGRGYWLVGADGGVFSFGDAAFYGSAAPFHPNGAVIAVLPTAGGRGYWLVGADGGVFSFGDAAFYGSAAPFHPSAAITAVGG